MQEREPAEAEVLDFETESKSSAGGRSNDFGGLLDEDQARAQQEMGRVNVAVLGVTGVGKSTLINSLFRVSVAETGIGTPVTNSIRRHEIPHLPITLYDTPGLELEDESGHLIKEVEELAGSLHGQDPNALLHVAWYCFNGNGTRFLAAERQTVTGVAEILPVALCATQVLRVDDEQYGSLLDMIDPGSLPILEHRAIPTLAQPKRFAGQIYEPHGLDDLVDVTLRALPEAARRAFLNSLRATGHVLDVKADEARLVVGAAAIAAGVVGAAPIPGSDAAVLVPIQALMMARVNAIFAIDMSREQVAGLAKALLTAGAVSIGGRYLAGELAKLIPGIGSAAAATVAALLTYSLGEAYIYMCRQIVVARAEGRTLVMEDAAQILLDHMIPSLKGDKLPDAIARRLPGTGGRGG